jgi:hypothetical protein
MYPRYERDYMDSVLYDIELPSGRKLKFKQFTFADRVSAAKMYQAGGNGNPRDLGYTLEEYMAASAIMEVDGERTVDDMGNQVVWGAEPIHLFSTWNAGEVQYFLEMFMTISFLDAKIQAQAQEQAKKLMASMSTPQAGGGRRSPAKVAG